MTCLLFTIPGRPLTWQRPPEAGKGRFDARGIAATKYAALVHDHARRAVGLLKRSGIAWPLDAEYGVRVIGVWPDGREGDEDRLRSLVYDALQGACYASDRQVKINDGGGVAEPDKRSPRLVVAVRVIGDRERSALALDDAMRARLANEWRGEA